MDTDQLQFYFQDIWAGLVKLQNETVTERRPDLLLVFNDKLADFSAQLVQFAKEMQEEVVVRKALMESFNTAATDDLVYDAFRKDQLNFYRSWLDRYGTGVSGAKEKCGLGLTAKQILILLRLAKEMGLLTEKQLKPYFYFLQTNFKTDVQETLSYESLRKKYSQLDKFSINKVKKMLREMLQRLDHYQAKV